MNRKSAQIPLEAISFSPEEKTAIVRGLNNQQNQAQAQQSNSLTPTKKNQNNPTQSYVPNSLAPTVIQNPGTGGNPQVRRLNDGRIEVNGRVYDPTNALHSDELEHYYGIRATKKRKVNTQLLRTAYRLVENLRTEK